MKARQGIRRHALLTTLSLSLASFLFVVVSSSFSCIPLFLSPAGARQSAKSLARMERDGERLGNFMTESVCDASDGWCRHVIFS